jgi:hypothetical protein
VVVEKNVSITERFCTTTIKKDQTHRKKDVFWEFNLEKRMILWYYAYYIVIYLAYISKALIPSMGD